MILALALIAMSAILSVSLLATWMYLCQFRVQERLLTELSESNRKVLLLSSSDPAHQSAVASTPPPVAPDRSNSRAPEEMIRPRMSR